jgi:hypothetical protein
MVLAGLGALAGMVVGAAEQVNGREFEGREFEGA